MQTNDVARILGAKADPASEHNQGPVLFGKIVVQPKFTCPDFDQLLGEERKPVIRVSLVSIFDPFTHKVTSDYLKIDDGENISHLEVSMDYRLETPEARKAFNALFKSSAKAFLMYQFRGNEENPVVMLELWAFEKLCEFDSPSDCTKRTSLTSHANTLVEALYPEMLVQQQESLLSEGTYSVEVLCLHNVVCILIKASGVYTYYTHVFCNTCTCMCVFRLCLCTPKLGNFL